MCGIAGIVWLNENMSEITRRLAIELLRGIEERGRDAAGIACYKSAGEVWIRKAPWPATRFVKYLERVQGWEEARIILLHARAATSCEPEYNVCNHPLVAPAESKTKIVSLVHNGIIYDEEYLARREIAVDTDALLVPVRERDRLDIEAVKEMTRIAGSKAVIITDGEKVYAFHDVSPLAWAHLGSLVVFASTRNILRRALAAVGLSASVEDFPTKKILEIDVEAGELKWYAKPAYAEHIAY